MDRLAVGDMDLLVDGDADLLAVGELLILPGDLGTQKLTSFLGEDRAGLCTIVTSSSLELSASRLSCKLYGC